LPGNHGSVALTYTMQYPLCGNAMFNSAVYLAYTLNHDYQATTTSHNTI